jgi:pyruvate dehydrogenase E1 component
MYGKGENVFYYITMMNEVYQMPVMPDGCEQGIIKGMYKYKAAQQPGEPKVNLMGSGAILPEVLKAQHQLETDFGIVADVWSVTSYKELYTDGIETDRWNLLHPSESPRQSYIETCFTGDSGPFIAASDYMKALPCSLAKWIPGRLVALGTDGYGRSDTRADLRNYFEVNSQFIVLASLQALVQEGRIGADVLENAIKQMDIDPEKISPMTV